MRQTRQNINGKHKRNKSIQKKQQKSDKGEDTANNRPLNQKFNFSDESFIVNPLSPPNSTTAITNSHHSS